jgi:hypothetical protein
MSVPRAPGKLGARSGSREGFCIRHRRVIEAWPRRRWGPSGETQAAAGSGSPVLPGSTRVEFELVPNGTLRLRHRHLPSAEAAASHAHGWGHYLGRLAAVAAGEDPGSDPWMSAGWNE